MSNVVTLTIAGDSAGAQQAFSNVGGAARDMGRDVDATGAAFDRAGERADNVDTKAMGFRDTLTGIQDGTEGVKRAAAGDWGFETLLLLGFGVGDLASGLTNFLIPAAKSMRLTQLSLNTAFLASPLTWIVIGIAAVVAIFVVLWKRSATFRDFWKGLWKSISSAAKSAWSGIKSAASSAWAYLKGIPGKIKSTFKSVASAISSPFKSAFNAVARAWNGTVGSLSWSVPGWVPVIGGNSISAPRLPTFHSGGTVPGAPGQYVPILAMAGERVSATGGGGGDGGGWVVVRGDEVVDSLIEAIARKVGRRGGDAAQLGIRFRRG